MARKPHASGFDPFATWLAAAQMTRLAVEAQMVIAFRMLGMAGVLPSAPSENRRMVAEKAKAFPRAGAAMAKAAAAGRPPEAVVSAGVKPLRQVTSSNVRRLSRRAKRTPARKG